MDTCTHCGTALGIGRFCTNCGQPVTGAPDESWRTDTAERPRAVVPPAAPATPAEPRFPLFADEALPEPETPALGPVPVEPPRHRETEPGRGHGWVPWVAGFVVLVLVGSLGAWLLLSGERDDTSLLAQDTPSEAAPSDDGPLVTPDPEPTRTDDADPTPSEEPVDLAGSARVKAPRSAAPGQDTEGNPVTFDAVNMLDGVAGTAWRMPGDGTDSTITFRFGSPTVLSQVGLINGYAKVGQDSRGLLDWYAGNRRVQEVEWSFDDGTVLTQTLTDTASVQILELDDVKTRRATVRLVSVGTPGEGRAARNFTAISDVRLLGVSL